jgi:dipeptidyl aminopeptidase/acylaminoacyl peptidase
MIRTSLLLVAAALAFAGSITMPSVPESVSPLRKVSVSKTCAWVRLPPGKGPFPAIVFLHGGLGQMAPKALQGRATGQTLSRFLAAGFAIAVPEFATRQYDPQNPQTLRDCLDVVDWVKTMPEVDPSSVVVYGTSGGGSLALEVAGEMKIAAAIADEPASILFAGMLTKNLAQGRPEVKASDAQDHMENPRKHYSPEIRKLTRAKIAKIDCPLLIVHGDVHVINRINEQIIIPELKAAGKKVEEIYEPGARHGYSMGSSGSALALKFYEGSRRFLQPLLKTQPKALEASMYKLVPAAEEQE